MTINPISYPISLPTTPDNPARARLVAATVVGVSRSPFTLETQTQKHGGQAWRMSYAMPPMELTAAEDWISKLLLLNGREKTFLMGDPANAAPQGTAKGINLIPNSEDFSGWTLTNCTITDGQTDPNAGSTADLYQTTASSNSFMRIVVPVSTEFRNGTLAGRTFTCSIYIKKVSLATSDDVAISIRNSILVTLSQTVLSATTSFQRVSVSHTFEDNGDDSFVVLVDPTSATAGDQMVVWGAVVEEAAAVGTYERRDQGPQVQYRNNLALSSQVFESTWTTTGTPVITDNAGTAPDGTTTAATIEDDNAGAVEGMIQDITVADDSVTRCFSVYLKESSGTGTNTVIRMVYSGGAAETADVKLTWSDHTLTEVSSPLDSGVEDVGGGWWRLWLSLANTSGGNTTCSLRIRPAGSTAADTLEVLAWGAQLTETAAPVHYIVTTGAAVTLKAPTSGDLVAYLDGWVPSSGVLNAGDYMQIGTGSTSRLHKVTSDVTTDEQGNAAIDIWPGLREVPSDNAVIYTNKPVGTFRLSANNQSWDINEAVHYGLGFDAEEAL